MSIGNKLAKLTLLILLLFLLVSAIGCGQQKESADKPDVQGVITVVDCIGREVEVPADVKRIGCLYAFTGHVTTMLGRGDDVVAINNGLRRDVLLNMICPSIGDNPIPYTHSSINIEELIKADPDLVFVKSETGLNPAETEKLDKFNIPYLVIDFSSIEEQKKAIMVIGQALGVFERAEKYNDYYQECIERVELAAAEIPAEEKVRLYHSVNEATRTDAPGTLEADWTEKTGVINVSVGQELRLLEGKNFCSMEQILLWDPEVIIVNEAGVADYMYSNPKWASLKAIKDKKVYQMPIGISRWGHPGGMETPLAILWTAKTIYPEYFYDIDIKNEARNYYKEFFDYELSDETLERILAGETMRIPKNQID